MVNVWKWTVLVVQCTFGRSFSIGCYWAGDCHPACDWLQKDENPIPFYPVSAGDNFFFFKGISLQLHFFHSNLLLFAGKMWIKILVPGGFHFFFLGRVKAPWWFFGRVTVSELEVQWILRLTIPCWPCCPDTASLVPCCPVLWLCRTIRVALCVWWEALVVTATLLFAASHHVLNASSERLYMNSLFWSLQTY